MIIIEEKLLGLTRASKCVCLFVVIRVELKYFFKTAKKPHPDIIAGMFSIQLRLTAVNNPARCITGRANANFNKTQTFAHLAMFRTECKFLDTLIIFVIFDDLCV